jgi:Family of unknown function (DUF6496)
MVRRRKWSKKSKRCGEEPRRIDTRSQVTGTGETIMATTGQKKKVEKVMHEHKEGTLKRGSGKKVRSRKQAIAIAMHESGQSRKK